MASQMSNPITYHSHTQTQNTHTFMHALGHPDKMYFSTHCAHTNMHVNTHIIPMHSQTKHGLCHGLTPVGMLCATFTYENTS